MHQFPAGRLLTPKHCPRASCTRHLSINPAATRITGSSSSSSHQEQPWQIGIYYTKKHTRKMDGLGNLQGNETADLLADDAKLRLAVQVVSKDTGIPEAELLQRMELLLHVLPDVDAKLQFVRKADLVQLARQVDDVAQKLLLLKQSFPQANVSAVCSQCTHILLLDLPHFVAAVQQVQCLLAGADNPSALLESAPMILDPAILQEVLQELQRLFGSTCQPLQLLEKSPSLALSCVNLKGQSRGDKDAEYLGSIFSVREPEHSSPDNVQCKHAEL